MYTDSPLLPFAQYLNPLPSDKMHWLYFDSFQLESIYNIAYKYECIFHKIKVASIQWVECLDKKMKNFDMLGQEEPRFFIKRQ